MLALPKTLLAAEKLIEKVAIPYSSGMLLLRQPNQPATAGNRRLVVVAIPYSSGMLLLRINHKRQAFGLPSTSQSPIHRECFCYWD